MLEAATGDTAHQGSQVADITVSLHFNSLECLFSFFTESFTSDAYLYDIALNPLPPKLTNTHQKKKNLTQSKTKKGNKERQLVLLESKAFLSYF